MPTLLKIVLLTIPSGFALSFLGIAVAAYTKSHDPSVIRSGFYSDYVTLATVMAGVGILCGVATIICAIVVLSQKKGR